jgi:putative flippase GtrA
VYNHKNFDAVFLRQFLKYAVVGCLAFLADFAVFSMLVGAVHYQIANYCGLVTGLVTNYFLSKVWVFRSQVSINKKEVLGFVGFTVFGFLLSGVGMYLSVELLEMNKKIAKFCVACIVFVVNFLARKYVIFKAG